ncbi:MAG: hypothetical protein HETSPECPRED_010434 [Heterodermia speciosa]|uniref:Transcription elongation factor 1 homolog n=1 Tax=Heterodermia speciosa TaxID=116794 RepID=A0A8H3G6H5_9LECA|nr:MAG: hypothetical protein HETSPECPRED_010434 [Heterodermia speciosa]
MGKRKKSARKPQGPKKNEPLPTSFPCLFCNHDKSVQVKLDKKGGIDLSGAVDVYADWVDACDQVAKENGEEPDEGLNSYADLAGGASGRRNSEMPYDRHVVAAAEGNTVADEYDDDM